MEYTKEQIEEELHTALKQNGHRSIMLDDEKRLAQGKAIFYLHQKALEKEDVHLVALSNMVIHDYATRAIYICQNPPK